MFHHFHGAGHAAGQGSISAEQFAQILRRCDRDRLLSAEEWLRRALAGELEPGQQCVTLDDNLRCQFDVALPVLRDMGLTAFWFVATSVLQGHLSRTELYRVFRVRHFASLDAFYAEFERAATQAPDGGRVQSDLAGFDPRRYLAQYPFYTESDRRFRFLRDEVLGPERYQKLMDQVIRDHGVKLKELAANLWMGDDHLRQLAAEGHVIGLHSHTHPTRLADLSPHEQRREYRSNHAYLTSLLGEPPLTVSHPCNSYSEITLRILRDLGVRVGFCSNMSPAGSSELEYPREDHANLLAGQ